MAFPKIMGHTQKDLIVKLLLEGRGVRYVAKTLKEMYPDDRKKWVSVPTLQKFRKEHLKLEGDALEEIKMAKRSKERKKDLKKEHTQVKNLPSYRRKLEEVVDQHIDIRSSLVGIHALLESRIEQFFDMAQSGEAARDDEKLLQGHFDRYLAVVEKWAKYVEKLADHRVEHNINLTIVNEQMALLRTAVSNVLGRMDPELAVKFVDELAKEMDSLSYRHDTPSLDDLSDSSHRLAAGVTA